jgi:hypothetical protein
MRADSSSFSVQGLVGIKDRHAFLDHRRVVRTGRSGDFESAVNP